MSTKPTTIDEYIAQAPEESKKMLNELRALLKKAAPKATEAIKWSSAVFEEKRILFAFTAYKSYVNFMPTGPSLTPFLDELKDYKLGKDTIQFPYDKPLPKKLISKIAAYRVKDVRDNDAKWMY